MSLPKAKVISLVLDRTRKTNENTRMEDFYTHNQEGFPPINWEMNQDGEYIAAFARLAWSAWQASQSGYTKKGAKK